jgi:hypothetical protein
MRQLLTGILIALRTTDPSDSINQCAAIDPTISLSDITTKPDALLTLADKHLHVFPFKDVKACWRRLYTDASIAKAVIEIQRHLPNENGDVNGNREQNNEVEHGGGEGGRDPVSGAHWIDEVVRILDMAVIMTGAPEREEMVEEIFRELHEFIEPESPMAMSKSSGEAGGPPERPSKRRKISPSGEEQDGSNSIDEAPTAHRSPTRRPVSGHEKDLLPLNSIPPPQILHPIPRLSQPSLSDFEGHISSSATPTPIIIASSLTHWPAIASPDRSWKRRSYLMSRTLGGRRLVPVEIGSSYTSSDWSQRIMPFKEFLSTYITPERSAEAEVGYLAQHHLLSQIPLLRPDISIPDYIYTDPPPAAPGTPVARSFALNPQSKLEEPIINTWFGPGWTVSPLHHDPWHNLLCQVMGRKYVRLYSPEETEKLYPRGLEGGVDMSNTSQVDIERYEDELRMEMEMGVEDEFDEAGRSQDSTDARTSQQNGSLRDWQEPTTIELDEPDDGTQIRKFPLFRAAKYVEAILEEGEMLYVPVGWWHYVRSLSTSWSVSFWWN